VIQIRLLCDGAVPIHNVAETQALQHWSSEHQRANRTGLKFNLMHSLDHWGTSTKEFVPLFYHSLTLFEKCGMQVKNQINFKTKKGGG